MRALLVALVLSLAATTGQARPPRNDDAPGPPPSPSSCATVTAVARVEAYGYTHVLVLDNHCSRAVVCTASTSADPESKVTLTAGPGATAEAITRRGSPAYGVTAQSECQFADK